MLTTAEFIERAKSVHGNLFNYDRVNYTGSHNKIEIICRTHGPFLQKASSHLEGTGCRKCARFITQDAFIKHSTMVHDGKYNYSRSIYTASRNKIEIICPVHGSFWQTAGSHMAGSGCRACFGDATRIIESVFESRSVILHNDKYDYSLISSIVRGEKLPIVCPKHGVFWQTPETHLNGRGCSRCADESAVFTTDEFIKRAVAVHGQKYDYSSVCYVNKRLKVDIICPAHGIFSQRPGAHINNKSGCPKCTGFVSKLETKWLDLLNIPQIFRQRYVSVGRKKYHVDAFVDDQNTVYEFFGDYWHGNLEVFSATEINKQMKRTFGELFEQTTNRLRTMADCGYRLIYIWELDFKKYLRSENAKDPDRQPPPSITIQPSIAF